MEDWLRMIGAHYKTCVKCGWDNLIPEGYIFAIMVCSQCGESLNDKN